MRKMLFLMLALALLAAERGEAQVLKLGVKGGVSTQNYDFKTVTIDGVTIKPGSNSDVGYQLGLVLRLSIPQFLQIQPELLYSSKKYDYVVSEDDMTNKVGIETKRFELPIMIGFNISALRIFAGPKFILASSTKTTNSDIPLSMDYVNKDIAFQCGFGLDIKRFFIDVTYSTYLGDNYDKFTYADSESKVRVKKDDQWLFNLGFFF